ncbi:MAG: hypothetical protein U9Q77_11605, partial [Candidatus Marinimicrobia bacterium]|nr:hypothetical protein [Candidatus Neomarinimicrobiota bacterium]
VRADVSASGYHIPYNPYTFIPQNILLTPNLNDCIQVRIMTMSYKFNDFQEFMRDLIAIVGGVGG